MTIASLIASIARNRPADGPDSEAIALHAVDTMGVLAAALTAREARAIAALYDEPDRVQAAAALAAIIRFSELDDIHVPSCMTAGAIAIPVATEFAVDASAFADAVEAGYAIGLAFAQAVGGVDALAGGVWPALFAAPAVAAVTAGVAMDLAPEQLEDALALALSASSGRAGRPGGWPSGRWVLFGEAVTKGIRAARAARAGAAGDRTLAGADWLACQAPDGLADASRLETLPRHATAAYTLKPFVAARQGLNAIEAFRALLARGLDPETIEAVDVTLPSQALGVVTRPLDPENRLSSIAHLGLQLGLAAFEPHRLMDIAREASFDPRSLALSRKVRVAAGGVPQGETSWSAHVQARASSGTMEERCPVLSGDPAGGQGPAMLAAKLERLGVAAELGDLRDGPTRGWKAFFQSLRRVHGGARGTLVRPSGDVRGRTRPPSAVLH